MASFSWLVRVNPTENSMARPRCSRRMRRCASHALVAPSPSARTRIGVTDGLAYLAEAGFSESPGTDEDQSVAQRVQALDRRLSELEARS